MQQNVRVQPRRRTNGHRSRPGRLPPSPTTGRRSRSNRWFPSAGPTSSTSGGCSPSRRATHRRTG